MNSLTPPLHRSEKSETRRQGSTARTHPEVSLLRMHGRVLSVWVGRLIFISRMFSPPLSRGPRICGRGPLSGVAATDCQPGQGCGAIAAIGALMNRVHQPRTLLVLGHNGGPFRSFRFFDPKSLGPLGYRVKRIQIQIHLRVFLRCCFCCNTRSWRCGDPAMFFILFLEITGFCLNPVSK